MKRYYLFVVMLLAMTASFTISTTAMAALVSGDVEKELMCQCGCTMVVNVCDCDTANQIRAVISEKISQGQSKEEILAYFVGQYGEKVLAAPTKKGFNLTVWVLPFVAIAAGGVGLYFILRTWSRRGKAAMAAEPLAESDESLDEYRRKFKEEFQRFNDEGDNV